MSSRRLLFPHDALQTDLDDVGILLLLCLYRHTLSVPVTGTPRTSRRLESDARRAFPLLAHKCLDLLMGNDFIHLEKADKAAVRGVQEEMGQGFVAESNVSV
jgi:hypothetical protein